MCTERANLGYVFGVNRPIFELGEHRSAIESQKRARRRQRTGTGLAHRSQRLTLEPFPKPQMKRTSEDLDRLALNVSHVATASPPSFFFFFFFFFRFLLISATLFGSSAQFDALPVANSINSLTRADAAPHSNRFVLDQLTQVDTSQPSVHPPIHPSVRLCLSGVCFSSLYLHNY